MTTPDPAADHALPPPLIPADVDLRNFPFTPMFRARLFGSTFHARSTDGEWRAGVTLWLKSWDQMPAGTLPDNDIDLCRLAELGRDVKSWRKLKAGALHGWIKCSDGRLYHPVVAEGVIEAWNGKQAQRSRTEAARQERLRRRQSQSLSQSETVSVTDDVTASNRKGEGERKKESNAPALDADASPMRPIDLNSALWSTGKAFLIAHGINQRNAGSLLGRWRRDHGEAAVIDALARAESESASDVVAFIEGVLRSSTRRRSDGRSGIGSRAAEAFDRVAARIAGDDP